MKLSRLSFFLPAIFSLKMSDEAPAAVVVVPPAENAPVPDATDVQRAADDTVRTATELARELARTPEQTDAIITAIGVLAQSVNDLGLSIFARLDEMQRDIRELRELEEDEAEEESAEAVAEAAVTVAEAAAETAQAVPAVAEAEAQAEVAAAAEPEKRGNEKKRRYFV